VKIQGREFGYGHLIVVTDPLLKVKTVLEEAKRRFGEEAKSYNDLVLLPTYELLSPEETVWNCLCDRDRVMLCDTVHPSDIQDIGRLLRISISSYITLNNAELMMVYNMDPAVLAPRVNLKLDAAKDFQEACLRELQRRGKAVAADEAVQRSAKLVQ